MSAEIYFTVNGFTGTLPEIAEHFDISYKILRYRMQSGMTAEEAINYDGRWQKCTVNGFTGTVLQIAEHFEINYKTILYRMRSGMTIEEAVNVSLEKGLYKESSIEKLEAEPERYL